MVKTQLVPWCSAELLFSCQIRLYSRLLLSMMLAVAANAQVTGPAYQAINALESANRSAFFIYKDADSGLNNGFPSGYFGLKSAVATDPACVFSAGSPDGCSANLTALDQARGTVFRVSFAHLTSVEFAGVNFEEPQYYGKQALGRGYDLSGSTQLSFDIMSPTPGMNVQIGVAGHTSAYFPVPHTWTTMSFSMANLGVSAGDLANVHILFGIATNGLSLPAAGGTVLLDNIQFTPAPTIQQTTLSLPLSNQVFGVVHRADAAPGPIPIPFDQNNANVAAVYDASLALIALIKRGAQLDLQNARQIADALVYAAGHDNQGDPLPQAANGSAGVHNAYSSGDLAFFNSQSGGGQAGQVRLAGFSAATLCPQTGFCLVLDGASGGNNAFVILALSSAYRQFSDLRYLSTANEIGNWIYEDLADNSGTGFGGYFVGYDDRGIPPPKPLNKGKSVENNADIFAAFSTLSTLALYDGNTNAADEWTRRANLAGDFAMKMFDSQSGRFFAGTVPVGTSASSGISPVGPAMGNDVVNTYDFVDANTFTTLALASTSRYHSQIDWRRPIQYVLSHFAASVTVNGVQFNGFSLIPPANSATRGIAWEFSSQIVATLHMVDSVYGEPAFEGTAALFSAEVLHAQSAAPFTDQSGIVAATLQDGDLAHTPPDQACLVTPFQCIPERFGTAATAWAIFAEQQINPFAIVPYGGAQSPKLYIDSPGSQSIPFTGLATFFGWAINATSAIASVSVAVDGFAVGNASYGLSRPDVCAAYPGQPRCPNVGWSFTFNTTQLSLGMHSLAVTATSMEGRRATVSSSFTVGSTNNPIRIYIDRPASSMTTLMGVASLGGWAIDDLAAVARVSIAVDGRPTGDATYGISRPDVCAAYPGRLGCPNVAWSYSLDTTRLSDGSHMLQVTATSAAGAHSTVAASFTVANSVPANPTRGYVDFPNSKTAPLSGSVAFNGWAIDDQAAVSRVNIYIDDLSYGAASYGVVRPDVCAAFPGRVGCPAVGWSFSLDTTLLGNGSHELEIITSTLDGRHATLATSFSVANPAGSPTRIYIDMPAPQSSLTGLVPFSGWAINDTAGIGAVTVSVDGASLGNANYGVNRLDVCSAYPGTTGCPNVGWQLPIDTTQWSDGSHRLVVVSTATNGQHSAVSTTFAVSNAMDVNPMRIYIDVPNSSSAAFTGVAAVSGWATDDSAVVSSVTISVDGVPVGNATYGASRPDVCAAFPNQPGCPSVGWSHALDTSVLSDGLHTLGVTATSIAHQRTITSVFRVMNLIPSNPIRSYIDVPSGQNGMLTGLAAISGWSIDDNAAINSIAVSVDGVQVGTANYKESRPDVCAEFPDRSGCPNVGWTFLLDTSTLANGSHTLTITAQAAGGQRSTIGAIFVVNN